MNGRSDAEFTKMVKQDIWYSLNQSIWLDIKIMFKTPFALLAGKGAG